MVLLLVVPVPHNPLLDSFNLATHAMHMAFCLLTLSFAFLSFVLFPYLRSSDRVNLKTQTVSRR